MYWLRTGNCHSDRTCIASNSVMSIKRTIQLNRSRKNLRRDVGHAISDFSMIEDGDLVMVCVSGGKDSYALLDILSNLKNSKKPLLEYPKTKEDELLINFYSKEI